MRPLVGLLLFLFLVNSSLSLAEEAKSADINLGVVLGLTGGAAFQASSVREGIELAVSELEKKGTVILL